MAVWADIGEDDEETSHQLTTGPNNMKIVLNLPGNRLVPSTQPLSDVRENVQHASVHSVAHALRCYPVTDRLASHLDLTDLSSLSMTCRSMHDALSQFAHQLKQHSLRCTFDSEEEQTKSEQGNNTSLHETFDTGSLVISPTTAGPALPLSVHHQTPYTGMFSSALGLSGKLSRCARDLVAPCRKCGTVVCRNCTAKSPSTRLYNNRLRRLCDACLDASLTDHMLPLKALQECSPSESSSSSTRSNRSSSASSEDSDASAGSCLTESVEISNAFLREACTCTSRGVFLCQPCGHNVRAADDIYRRVWSWRSRYSTHLGGGLGTGLGLGNQGQKCGRGKYCLAKRDAMALMETECSGDESQNGTPGDSSRAGTPLANEASEVGGSMRFKPGYLRQEIEGIGGVVKSKSKRLVKVGATVYEFREERESGKYLDREARGVLRSWCSWCSRVCPGEQDLLETAKVSDVIYH